MSPTLNRNWPGCDGGNNRKFLDQGILSTVNPSLSIPGARVEDPEIYLKKMNTIEWPNAPDGKPIRMISSVKQAVIFAESKNQETAREFLKYLIEPETLMPYIKGTNSRFFPVMPNMMEDPFWKQTKNPHIVSSVRQLSRPTRPFFQTLHPAYASILSKGVWGRALTSIALENKPPTVAAKNAIGEIRKIFADWEKQNQ